MHFVDTELDHDGNAWLVVQQTHGVRDLVAALIYRTNEDACTDAGACLINPPAWAWRLGGHRIFSLGGLVWHTGQWAYGRAFGMEEIYRTAVTTEELVDTFGWTSEATNREG